MKNRWALLLALVLLPCVAGAEVVGRTGDGYIHRYVALNGQEIYYYATEEETLVQTGVDVNFDGQPDLAVVTALGAANTFYEFYLWNGSEYVYAERWTDDIINYTLVDGRYLVSQSNDGDAGALFKTQICVWDGQRLKCIRTMVSEEDTVTEWSANAFTTTTYTDRLRIRLCEADPDSGEAAVIWEKIVDSLPEAPDFFGEIEQRLWEGLL